MQTLKAKPRNYSRIIGAVLCLLSSVVLFFNMLNMFHYLKEQRVQRGEAYLQKASGDIQRMIERNKTVIHKLATDIEVYLALEKDHTEIQRYLQSQSGVLRDQSKGTLLNTFIYSPDWVLISDSPLPEGYTAEGREWYINTVKNGIGNVYLTAPYEDLFTGEMCFTFTILLSDGKTAIGMDFDISPISESMEKMSDIDSGETLIINRDGLVVGYNESGYMGQRLADVLPEYVNVYERLVNEKNDTLFLDTNINGNKTTTFCNRSGEWFFVYTIDNRILYKESYKILFMNFIPRIAMIIALFVYSVYFSKARYVYKAETAANPDEKPENSSIVSGDITGVTKKTRNSIMSIMAGTIAVAVAFTGIVLVNWGNDRMEREVNSYNYQLERWMNTQLQILNMFVDTISANPVVLDDYDFAVDYLDRIVSNHPEISAAYIARPGNEHEMTMNNGWIPNADYVVSERQWYIDTENSEDGKSVSSPYLDARTGLYCMTFSKVVYDSRTGEHIGVFALDFYLENLTVIMEESYSDDGYAFLVDNSDIIVNHPNDEYQISEDRSVNISGTEYSEITKSQSVRLISDYDGSLKACISRTDPVTGFSVIAVKDVWSIYGIATLCGGIFIVLLVLCIILIYNLIMKMMNWQESTRQALIEEVKRASQADHAKSSFLAQMSHEIRTPINAVLGMNEMILRESKEKDILNYASNAYNAGNALLSIINDILDISKIEAGKLEITESEYDLYSLISNCYNMTLNRAEKKGLAFKVICEESLPAKLRGDMFHIRQITVNLITNAIKYTDKGFVELSFSGIRDEEGFKLVISVKDTGIGLKPESLEKLFTSFQRFDLERNQSVEGTGLGLSICRQLAELMGGSVKAESVYGEGSVFTCTIPQESLTDSEIGELHLERSADKVEVEKLNRFIAPKARILAVDDVEMNLFVFSSFLREHKMFIETASSGRECLELLAENNYDVIFMDHMMPEMDGIETLQKMREMKLAEGTPVVMLTANAILGEEEKYLAAGFDSYLTKPIQVKKLENALIKYLPEEKIIYQEGSSEPEITAEEDQPQTELICEPEYIDINTGMNYNGGSKKMYYRVLKMYVKSGMGSEGKLERIRSLKKSQSWKEYVTEVHALKSTSLVIGAKRLSELAKELEHAGRDMNYELIAAKNDTVLDLYGKVLSIANEMLLKEGISLESAEHENTQRHFYEVSGEKLIELIEQVNDACAKFDDEKAVSVCDEAAEYSYKRIPLMKYFDPVKECINDFDYDGACENAEALYSKFDLK